MKNQYTSGTPMMNVAVSTAMTARSSVRWATTSAVSASGAGEIGKLMRLVTNSSAAHAKPATPADFTYGWLSVLGSTGWVSVWAWVSVSAIGVPFVLISLE